MSAVDDWPLDDIVAGLRAGDSARLAPLFGDPTTPATTDAAILRLVEAGAFDALPALAAEALTTACWLGQVGVARALLDRGVDPHEGTATGTDALHWAANRGQLAAVELLLARGAGTESTNHWGGTALDFAVWSAIHEPQPAHPAIIDALLGAGADPARVDAAGLPPAIADRLAAAAPAVPRAPLAPRDAALLRHALGAIAYRAQKALRDAPEGWADFTPGARTRTPRQLVGHLASLMGYVRTFFLGGHYPFVPAPLGAFAREVARFHRLLDQVGRLLAAGAPVALTTEQLLQGPLADALTHVGQLALLRRLGGAPVPPENFIHADVRGDRLGPDQPPPAAPDAHWPEAPD